MADVVVCVCIYIHTHIYNPRILGFLKVLLQYEFLSTSQISFDFYTSFQGYIYPVQKALTI